MIATSITFDNEFDMINRDIDEVEIKETYDKTKCLVWDIKDPTKCYNTFVIKSNSQSTVICKLSFYKSGTTNKYVPRPDFIRLSKSGDIKTTKSQDKVIVSFNKSEDALIFWKLITFIKSFKDIVDIDDLQSTYKVVAKDSYFIEFSTKSDRDQAKDILELVKKANLNSTDVRSIVFESRKKDLKSFYYLLLNLDIKELSSHEYYRKKHSLGPGLETIWHHFLKNHEWILGLNLEIVFIRDFLNEQKVGVENSVGSGSPKTDLLGISEYTTLVELKHSETEIFKKTKSKGRANTWDFTTDFIEGVSQCLGQKEELAKGFLAKDFINSEGKQIDKRSTFNLDPDSIFIVGCRSKEFSLKEAKSENISKYKTFHRFRRNNRNVTIVTFDELFERAYYTVYNKKLAQDWYEKDEAEILDYSLPKGEM